MRHKYHQSTGVYRRLFTYYLVAAMSFSTLLGASAQVPAPEPSATIDFMADSEMQLLIHNLGSEDAVASSQASHRLAEIKAQAIPAVITALSDPDEDVLVRSRAAAVLARGLPSGADAIPTLMRLLGDRSLDSRLRRTVARVLSSIIALRAVDPDAKDSPDLTNEVPVLIKFLEDQSEDVEVRAGAAWALREIGPGAQAAVPGLLETLREESPRIRSASVHALGMIGAARPEIVEPLILALRDEDENVRESAAGALGEHKGDAERIVAALNESLDDESESFRIEVVRAFGSMDAAIPGVVTALVKALSDDHDWVREQATEALGNAGPEIPEVIPALISALGDSDPIVKWYAARALGSYGDRARDAIPALEDAILAKDHRNESHIIEPDYIRALRALGADLTPVIPRLVEALNGNDRDAQGRAARALGAIGAQGLPALAAAIADPNEERSHEARYGLSFVEFPLDGPPGLTPDALQVLLDDYGATLEAEERNEQRQPTYIAQTKAAIANLELLRPSSSGLPDTTGTTVGAEPADTANAIRLLPVVAAIVAIILSISVWRILGLRSRK
jgi:HEAT repeat protein